MASKRNKVRRSSLRSGGPIDRLFEELNKEDMPGEYVQIWHEMVTNGEIEFENDVADFPYVVDLPLVEKLFDGGANIAMLEYCDSITSYLRDTFAAGTYIVFPNNAIGRYIEKANSVFFKYPADAVLFKLSI